MQFLYDLFGYCNNEKLHFTQEDLIKRKQNLKKMHTLNRKFYLPDLDEITDKIIQDNNASSIKDMGVVMAELNYEVAKNG